jgi:hypothetical protein
MVPYLQWIFRSKISNFASPPDIFLRQAGERIPEDHPSVKLLDKQIRKGRVKATLKKAGGWGGISGRVAFKAWWDEDQRVCRATAYRMSDFYVAPHPMKPWSVDSAPSVAIFKGFVKRRKRYEIWGQLNPSDERIKNAESAGVDPVRSVAYETDGEHDYLYDPRARNPFVDPRTGMSMYPFVVVRFTDDDDIYYLPDHGILEQNRRLNERLTDIQYGWYFNMHPTQFLESTGQGSSKAPSKIIAEPGGVHALKGWTHKFQRPDTNIGEAESSARFALSLDGRTKGVDVEVIFGEQGSAASGVSLRIKRSDLMPILEDQRGIIQPDIEEGLYRWAVVHDTYADEKILFAEDVEIGIQFADPPIVDMQDVVTSRLPLVQKNILSVVEVRQELKGETREEAITSIEQNKEDNKEYGSSGEAPPFGGGFPPVAAEDEDEQEEDGSADGDEDEEDKEEEEEV